MGVFRDFLDAHERLKKRIHSTRIPLGPKGKAVMTVVYFTTPIICGYFVMQWAQSKAKVNLKDVAPPPSNPTAYQNDTLKRMLKDIHTDDDNNTKTRHDSAMDAKVDAIQDKLRAIFEIKSGYKDEATQAKLLEKHFRYFDTDGSGVIDFHEFTSAMLRLNFVGVQAELEGLFDRYDEDLSGTLSYSEFATVLFGSSGKPNTQVKSIIDRVKSMILENGGKNGIRTLQVILRRMDQNGDKTIDKEEFHNGLLELGIQPNEIEGSELDKVFAYFDRDGNGRITLDELLRGLRGGMSKRRIQFVRKAFDLLDESRDGVVTIDEIADRFDTSHHPDVLSGLLKPQDVLRQFLAGFEGNRDGQGDGVVTWSEFLAYYRDLSAGIDSDDEFELIVRNAWHMSGGEGWCENTTCRRVLVLHGDGSQEICEIQNDLGIGPKDRTKMIRQLLLQGVRDIADVKLAT
ncbi:unnamed protein product [Aphanomyces euteiches]